MATCETSQVMLAGVAGGFPGVLPFRPTYRFARLDMSEIILKGTLNCIKKKKTSCTVALRRNLPARNPCEGCCSIERKKEKKKERKKEGWRLGYKGIRQQKYPDPGNWIEHLDTGVGK